MKADRANDVALDGDGERADDRARGDGAGEMSMSMTMVEELATAQADFIALRDEYATVRERFATLLTGLRALEAEWRKKREASRQAALRQDEAELRGQAWGETGVYREAADKIAALLKEHGDAAR